MNLLLSILLSFAMTSPAVYGGGGKSKSKKKTVTVEGTYRSLRGVMQPISCYCNDAAYITTANGDEINVCFEHGELESSCGGEKENTCTRIRVTGVYVETTINPDPSSPCPAGTMRYLKVSKLECLR